MEVLDYAEFSERLRGRMAGGRVPTSVTIELTHRCPLACQHCYNNLPMADEAARRRELSAMEISSLLDELAEAGTLRLLFTGGEIFARPDFLEIYLDARKKGFLVTLYTNGTLITERIADTLAEWPPSNIEITLYGRTRETYEALTQAPGSYDRCMRGIRLLMERQLPLKLKATAVSINRHEVLAMEQFARELGVEFRFDPLLSPRIDCSQSPLAVRLRPHEVVALDLADPRRAAEYERKAAAAWEQPPAPQPREHVYICGGGLKSFAVDPYGRMSLCVISSQEKYDLRRGSVRGGWEQFLGEVRSRKVTRPTKCSRCGLRGICAMCPANGELENGDPEQPVAYLCEVAHLRAVVFGFPVPEHGECEFCPGGERHAELQSAAALARAEARREHAADRQALIFLPMFPAGTAAVGCETGGCATCAVGD